MRDTSNPCTSLGSFRLPAVNFWCMRCPGLFRKDSDKNEIRTTWISSQSWIVLPSPRFCFSNGNCQSERERGRRDREWWVQKRTTLGNSSRFYAVIQSIVPFSYLFIPFNSEIVTEKENGEKQFFICGWIWVCSGENTEVWNEFKSEPGKWLY